MQRACRRFGRVRQLPSSRWQARNHGPDGIDRAAPNTFERRSDADRWSARTEDDLRAGDRPDPDAGLELMSSYGVRWVQERAGPRPRTRRLHEGSLRLHISLGLGGLLLTDIPPALVRTCRSNLLTAGLGEVTVAKACSGSAVVRTVTCGTVSSGRSAMCFVDAPADLARVRPQHLVHCGPQHGLESSVEHDVC